MKKFFVGLLSIFLIFGATMLAACGKETPVLKLSQDSVAVRIHSDEPDSGYEIITAEVSGVSDTSIKASTVSGYENVISVSSKKTTEGKTQITVTGITEGYAEFIVRTNQGNAYKIVTVDVYSEVSSMEQKTEEVTKKNNFAIRGSANNLIENNLIKFTPSEKSRREITWSLVTGTINASIENNILTIDELYDKDEISLIATTEKEVSTTITIPVVDKIESELDMLWSYSQNTSFEEINEENNQFVIIPNLPSDEAYEGYIVLNYLGELDIQAVVTTKDGKETDDLIVSRQGDFEGKPLFKVFANKSKSNLNSDYIVYFNVGYANYNYSINTLDTNPINIEVREKVNNIILSTSNSYDIDGTTQTLYTDYAGTLEKGKEFTVSVTPTTVIGLTSKYSINVSFLESILEPISEGNPVEFWYKDANNGNIWTQIPMVEDVNGYKTVDEILPSVSKIYIKASSTLKVQSYEGIRITFTSQDNTQISTSFNVRLVKSVSADDFVFENADFRIDSSESASNVVIKKEFTLKGQTSVDGLYIINNSEHVTISQPQYLSNTEDSVTFEIVLALKNESFGVTSLDSYQIAHENGLISEEFDVDIFLPLKSAGVRYDNSNESNSVTAFSYSNEMYDESASTVVTSMESINHLMLKNNTVTPVLYSFNTSNGQNAVAKISVSYLDFVESEEEGALSLEDFLSLSTTSNGILEIINSSTDISSYINFTNNNSTISTKGVGYTYAVIRFTGKGVGENIDENGNVTYIRIILIESYISPDGLEVYPNRDQQVELYANDTVATRDESDTTKRITINFDNDKVTYNDLINFEFVSTTKDSFGKPVMGNQNISGNTITWTNGRYSISNIAIDDKSISFDIVALTTKGEYAFSDELNVHYVLKDENLNTIYDIFTKINVTIKNAQRVESLIWRNSDDDGIYFRVGENEPFYMVLASTPIDAKNLNMTYVITDNEGQVTNTFVTVTDRYSTRTLEVNLPEYITTGMNGYIYVLPEDAVYNNQIKYYYMDGESELEDSISLSSLGLIKNSETNQTWYDFLVENAYFKSNATSLNIAKAVSFGEIIVKTKVTVADGKSFENAYRIYDEDDFKEINPELYYTVMNSLDLTDSSIQTIDVFKGGIQGYDENTTLTLSKNFANLLNENAVIRNLTFSGNVTAEGFVVSVNNGLIDNVTVDVIDRYSSELIVNGQYGGGIAGINYGTINNAKVLGLNITSLNANATVGGITGLNAGNITNSKVEFYNLLDKSSTDENMIYAVNTFTGGTVGGIAGELAPSSLISYSYAYSYKDVIVLDGNTSGALAGTVSSNITANTKPTIDYSFAYVYNISTVCQNISENINLTNYYVAYYNGATYSVNFVSGYQSNPNFVQVNSQGFLSYVNDGNPHLKNLYQDETIDNVSSYNINTNKTNNGYYKSVSVDDNHGILVYYGLDNQVNELTSTEKNDLNALNSLTLSQLIGKNVSKNVVITSSNSSILKVVGNTIKVLKTGEIEVTLSSKQNVEINKTILVKIVNAISDIEISWNDKSTSYKVDDNSLSYIQRTKSRDYILTYSNPTVILGNMAQEFDLVTFDGSIIAETEATDAINVEKISNSVFKVSAVKEDTETKLTFKFKGSDVYTNALNNVFKRSFSIVPSDGVIEFSLSEGNLPITPSTNGTIRVQIQTTAENDSVFPVISYNGEELKICKDENNTNIYTYQLLKDMYNTKSIIKVQTIKVSEELDTITGVYTYVFDVNFALSEDYKSDISEDMSFDVYFMSTSGNSSKNDETQTGSFELLISRQKFTNIDVVNMKIESSRYQSADNGYITVHQTGTQTAVLAPGKSSILKINVNPSFAYYDYMEITYSGATVSNAVNLEHVKPYNNNNTFTRSGSNVEMISSALRYTPTAKEKNDYNGSIYFKIWINTTVNSDSVIKFTATFYESEGDVITHVNYYLSISYLKEPTITIEGDQTAYVANGSTSEVLITVLKDQKLDSIGIVGENVSNVGLSSLSDPEIDEEKGIKTYTAYLNVGINASATNGLFYIQGQVSRELNGSEEVKTAQATAIIVDFKLDANNIRIDGTEDNNLTVWLGVPKALNINYNLLPEEYIYDASDSGSVSKVRELNQKRESFLSNQYYPASLEDTTKYLINYKYNKSTMTPEKQTIEDRLFFVTDENVYTPITDKSVNRGISFIFSEELNTISIVGESMGKSIQMVLVTYVSAGGISSVYETKFTVHVEAYSDPDIPIIIANAGEFNALNPSNYETSNIAMNDYILENDIVLENYTSFNTDAIRSLDGNGYTIYIKNYNLETSGSTLNLALFNIVNENTTLKNVRVNLYNGGQLTIDKSVYKSINIAGIAIANNGVIYNSEVVSYYSERAGMGEILSIDSCSFHNEPLGINVKFVNGKNTTDSVYVTDGSDWTPRIAGFVLENSGSISNSRVGGDEITIIENDVVTSDGKATGLTNASIKELSNFYIIGQGNMAGFVLENSGYIASSFAKNLDMENQSNTTDFYVSGFVGMNYGSVITSYVEADETKAENIDTAKRDFAVYARQGTSLKSALGCIAGFTYNNSGNIKDSYSNILIANSAENVRVYLASGFVYMNNGAIENSFSGSQITNSKFTQMNFSGVDSLGNLLSAGTYTNCYFFNLGYASAEDNYDDSTETQFNTGAKIITDPKTLSNFYGFAIASGESDGIWSIKEETGITLVETNIISISHRYTLYGDEDIDLENIVGSQGTIGENENGKYILPYATLIYDNLRLDTSLGSANNPIIIADAQDFVEISGTSKSTYVQKYFNNKSIFGTYRLVNNIDLSQLSSTENSVILPSTTKAFSGTLQGNGFKISGISITSDLTGVAFGLFSSIEKNSNLGNIPTLTNIDFEIEQVGAGAVALVGGVAGYVKDSIIINIDVSFKENASITGLNFVGGFAGLAVGNNIVKNINITDPTVIADRIPVVSDVYFATASDLKAFRLNLKSNLNYNTSPDSKLIKQDIKDYSYTGGVFGFVDNYNIELDAFNYDPKLTYSIDNVRVNGEIYIRGAIAGGVFGLTSYQTNIRDVGLLVDGSSSDNSSKIIATKYFAGGIVGQSFGAINRSFSVYEDKIQKEIENSMSDFYLGKTDVERGALDIFYSKDGDYTQKYIGGIAGFVASGVLNISYSKLNVTSPTAEYAGGIIGGMELANANSYKAQKDNVAVANTTYYINEVYATGDVRANTMAGGLIGVIKGEGSKVALHSVNALNYITNYDYSTGTYNALNEGQTNLSANYKVNALVGHFVKYKKEGDSTVEQIVSVEIDSLDNYQSFVNLIQVEDDTASGDSNSDSASNVASVAYYEYYNFGNLLTNVTLNIFGNIDGKLENNKLYNLKLTYAIASPVNYTDAIVGHSYTQVGFINSGSWSNNNWNHFQSDLFPTIKYTSTIEVIYLDCHNIKEVFEAISGKNYKVIIRGEITEGSKTYADVNIPEYIEKNKNITVDQLKVENFSGSFVGGGYKTSDNKEIKIIANQSFIKSVGPGFAVRNVTVEYKAEDNTVDTNNKKCINLSSNSAATGLFVESNITEASITNLTINLQDQVQVTTDGNLTVGIVAPIIDSTSINKITINTGKEIGGEDSALIINGTSSDTTLYAGLIAGQLTQSSTISIMQVSDIDLNITNSIAISDESQFKNISVGTYFGKVERITQTKMESGTIIPVNSQEIRLNLEDLYNNNAEHINTGYSTININGSSEDANINVGGYIGEAINVSYITTNEKSIELRHRAEIFSSKPISTVNAGLIIGKLQSTYTLNINGQSSSIVGGLYRKPSTEEIKTLNAGGIFGSIGTDDEITSNLGSVKVSNFKSINYEVASYKYYQTKITKKIDDLNSKSFENYNEDNNVKVVNANLGVVVGVTHSSFEFAGLSNSSTELNKLVEDTTTTTGSNVPYTPNNSFRVNATGETNIGSVIGLSTASNGSNNSSDNTNPKTININGKIISYLDTSIVSTSDSNNFGGMVGNINSASANAVIGNANLLQYNGAVFSNSKCIKFGGALGNFTSTSTNEQLIKLDNIAFGGALKVYGAKVNSGKVFASGVVGCIEGSNSTNLSITNNYLYGDVFVEYSDTLKALTNYYFGGIIAQIETYKTLKVQNNYSLTTTHNARYQDKTGTAYALFGAGVKVSTDIQNNYYSHSVTLAVQPEAGLGTDAGYSTTYLTTDYGYNNDCTTDFNVIKKITEKITGNVTGHKLNPINLSTATNNDNTFNGLTYYIVDSLKTNQALSIKNTDINNVALIGEGKQIDFTFNDDSSDGFYAPINTLSGHSYVSGLVVNVDITIEDAINSNYAGLIGEMQDNSIVYASQVKGNIELGGENVAHLSGIVGQLTSGKISDSSMDADLIYRAKGSESETKAGMYGIAKLVNSNINDTPNSTLNKIIENSYSAGSLTSYIDADIYAFTNGASYAYVNNSYTFTHIDWNDYTNETSTINTNTFIAAFGSESTKYTEYKVNNCVYDENGFNRTTKNNANGTDARTALINVEVKGKNVDYSLNNGNAKNSPWIANDITKQENGKTVAISQPYYFNYGYPTLRYGYLKISSYATRVEGSDNSTTGYDAYAKEYIYTRLANNSNPTLGNFFMIPNSGVLANVKNHTDWATKNYVLTYDIDIANYDATSDDYQKDFASLGEFQGIFDGQEKTISHLKTSLFTAISKNTKENANTPEIRNLRLTTVPTPKSVNDPAFSSGGLLAGTIKNATISNMTLSGSIDATSSANATDFGALANTIESSEISTITNLTTINVNGEKVSVNVGGITGKLIDSKILYSSNYGNINAKECETQIYCVGGLVGKVESTSTDKQKISKISYSYNTASVIAGYDNTAVAAYYVGGLVGYGTLDIDNSYNSGLIKSGNKENKADCEIDEKNTSSYAGGIIGYGVVSTISDCFNEGSVEALGENPETKFTWETINSAKHLVLRQVNKRNVYAYGIGYVDSGSITNVKEVYGETDSEYIYNNGAFREKDYEIQRWAEGDLLDHISPSHDEKPTSEADNLSYGKITHVQHVWKLTGFLSIPYVQVRDEYYRNIWVRVRRQTELDDVNNKYKTITENRTEHNNEDIATVEPKSYDNLGIPTSFSVEFGIIVQVYLNKSSSKYSFNYANDKIAENRLVEYSPIANADYSNYYNLNRISNIGASGSATIDTIKSNTRSQEKGVSNVVNIAGAGYYMVDSNNTENVFNAGFYTKEITHQLENVPYINNKNNYTVTAKLDNKEIGCSIDSVYEDNGKYYLRFTCYSDNKLDGKITYNINCKYEQNIIIDASSIDYVFTDYYSVGLKLGETFSVYNKAKKISKGSVVSYDEVVKASIKAYDYEDNQEPVDADNDENFYYFGYDKENSLLVYIPNATLTLENGTKNVNENSVNLANDESFVNNVKDIISQFAGKTLYFRTDEGDYGTKNISFSNSGTATVTIEKEENTKTGTINYGSESSVVYTSNVRDEYTYNGSFDIILTNVDENVDSYTISEGNNTIATYTKDSGWSIETEENDIVINVNGTSYTGSLSGGDNLMITFYQDISFNNISPTEFKNQVKESISSNLKVNNDESLSEFVSISTSEGQFNITSDTHSYEITINNLTQDALILSGDKKVLFGYGQSSVNSSLFISGKEFGVTVSDNKITLINTGSGVTSLQSNLVSDYISSLILIKNDFTNTSSIASPFTTKTGLNKEVVVGNGKVILTYSYKNESWNVTGDNSANFSLTNVKDGSATISLNDEVTKGLTPYTLNGVTVYWGTINYEATHNYQVQIDNVRILGFNNSIFELSVQDNDPIISKKLTSNDASENPNNNNIFSFDENDKIKVSIDAYATYELDVDDSGEFGICMTDSNGNKIYIESSLTKSSDTSITDDTIDYESTRVYIMYGGTEEISYQYSFDKKSAVTDEQGNVVTSAIDTKTLTYYDGLDNIILTIATDNIEKTTTILYYYNSDGTLAKTTDENDTSVSVNGAVLPNNKIFYTSNKVKILYDTLVAATISYEEFENIVELDDRKLYVDSNYKVSNELKFKYTDSEQTVEKTQKTFINTKQYKWIEETLSGYLPIERILTNPVISTVSNTSVLDYSPKPFDSTVTGYKFIYTLVNNKISMILGSKDSNYCDIKISLKGKYESEFEESKWAELNVDIKDADKPLSIILTNDISLKSSTISKKNGTNIIGNNYYISFYNEGKGFYKDVNSSDGDFIRDVNYLGDLRNSSFFATEIGKTKDEGIIINNTNFYGSVNGYNESSKAIIFDLEKAKLNSVNTYISSKVYINGEKSYLTHQNSTTSNRSLMLFNIKTDSNLTNYGILEARNGVKGVDGDDRSGNGKDGTVGGSIIVIKQKENDEQTINLSLLTNNGILISGNGGNAGSGYDRKAYTDFVKSSYTYNVKELRYLAGLAGSNGQVIGLKENVSANHVSKVGTNGYNGAVGRKGLGVIKFKSFEHHDHMFYGAGADTNVVMLSYWIGGSEETEKKFSFKEFDEMKTWIVEQDDYYKPETSEPVERRA